MVFNIFSRTLKLRAYQQVAFHHPASPLHAPYGFRWVPKDVNTIFKSEFSVSSISYRPSGVHQTMITKIAQSLQSALPPDPENKLTIGLNQPVVGFSGKYALSRSYPDLMLQCRNKQLQNETLLALELGFSEGYAGLQRSKKLWIEGTETAPMVLVIKISEYPRYANPLTKYGWEKRLTTELPSLASIKQEDVRPEELNDPNSPLFMYGLQFAGRLSASFELSRRNKDGKEELVEKGDIYGWNTTPSNLEIPLSEIIPRKFDVEGKKWILKWQDITKPIEPERKTLAFQRCWSAITAKEARDITLSGSLNIPDPFMLASHRIF